YSIYIYILSKCSCTTILIKFLSIKYVYFNFTSSLLSSYIYFVCYFLAPQRIEIYLHLVAFCLFVGETRPVTRTFDSLYICQLLPLHNLIKIYKCKSSQRRCDASIAVTLSHYICIPIQWMDAMDEMRL